MTDSKPGLQAERIVAAAILRDGVVFTGAHHHQIIRYAVVTLGIRTMTGEQGFITSHGRFVARAQAAEVAFAAEQIGRLQEALFSEQLWELPDYPPQRPNP